MSKALNSVLNLRDMQLLTALDRHRHFARAAEATGISQPAFSARIRNLELDLGITIVNRGNRFRGFTEEGEIVLRWGQKMLADLEGLKQEVSAASGALTGTVSIGVVPTALAFASALPARIGAAHPGLRLNIHSTTSDEIRRGLQNFTFSAGISYLEGRDPALSETHLYEETYLLVAPAGLVEDGQTEITWSEAARLPLCLLTPTMQNRRILERIFAGQGVRPNAVTETNALSVAWLQLRTGTTATIMPERTVSVQPSLPGTVTLRLTEPDISRPIALLLPDRTPEPALHPVLKHHLQEEARARSQPF
ncbi:LysR family transcriptional regulator [Algicella marina]|uniref:LysR family transcriptional regulator n=1 Tax=Algicella marina TaxID=2683284 RepID=A0A6P1SX50_9RHOB|nr:LysR family transcriptional regulator [Algicella marina]QHQ34337.1 LysR family transcriptional regulator [Algicella marina]